MCQHTLVTIKTFILFVLILSNSADLSAQTNEDIALQNQDVIQLRNQLEDERCVMDRRQQQIEEKPARGRYSTAACTRMS